MSYYKLLGLEKEPFSPSPDPAFFYPSREYDLVLTNCLIELRLRRGLNVILGDIGTGKTTLSRKLVQELHKRSDFLFHVILNPTFDNEKEFLLSLISNFHVTADPNIKNSSVYEIRDEFEKFLLKEGLTNNRIVVLIIDEAQKISEEILESLRILLNYETNEFKLIQIVLLGQMELYPKITAIPNFYDRIDFKYTLNPLGFEEAYGLVRFRLHKAGLKEGVHLFNEEAVRVIYYATKGYPRGIIRLCHKCLRALVISKNKTIVDRELAEQVIQKDKDLEWKTVTIPQNENC